MQGRQASNLLFPVQIRLKGNVVHLRGSLESLNDGGDLISNLFEQAGLICAAHK